MNRTNASDQHIAVLVVGAGPVGLTLALELNRYGIPTLLVDKSVTTTRHPKMDITNARSMEFYRRLGIADRLRAVAVPADRRMTVTWATNFAGWELARFEYPSVDETRARTTHVNNGTATLEPSMRVSQVLLEPVLREEVDQRAPLVETMYGWTLESFSDNGFNVIATLLSPNTGERRTVTADYLLACDGASSVVRKQLGIALDVLDVRSMLVRELGLRRLLPALARNFRAAAQRPMSGRFALVHFHTSDPSLSAQFGHFWHLQSPEGWTLISQDDAGTYTLHVPLGVGEADDAIDPRERVYRALGHRFSLKILAANAWTPRLTVADSYGRGRVWLAGDAVHQVTPTGGYGMNTGVGDAVGLAWAIAAQVQGWGGSALLTAYEKERRDVALRNRTAAARHAAVRGAILTANWAGMHSERWHGAATRERLGREIRDLGNLENEAWGIEHGYRYDSPVIASEAGHPPPLLMDRADPTTWPGARPPSVHLTDGRALFDLFGAGFTLVRFADVDVSGLVAAAEVCRVPLAVVDVRDAHARRLYQRDLVLIRPDQHVAWRGDTAPDRPAPLLDRVRGAGLESASSMSTVTSTSTKGAR